MAEKIVQLRDNHGNNVYPVAGSMKQGSITTNMLSNGAVTANKIDFNAFATKQAGFNSDIYSLTASYQDIATLQNVPAGTFLAMVFTDVRQTTGTTHNIVARVNTSTDGYIEIGAFNVLTENVTYWNHLCGFCIFTTSSIGTVKLQFNGDGSSWGMNQIYGRFLITRIA